MTEPAGGDSVVGRFTGRLAGPAVIAASFVAMLAWTWLKWPDPLIDFGRELYLAWQVAEGKTLYRDIEHFNGPLSVTFNAALFRIFGIHLQTLVWANILIAAAIVAMTYHLLRHAAGRAGASAACVTFVTLFMCLQLVDTGNFNFITPYSHEITHGILLSLAAMTMVLRSAAPSTDSSSPRFAGFPALVAAGATLGLLWLTKFEVFLAGSAAAVLGTLLIASTVPRWKRLVTLVAAAAAVVVMCLGLMCIKLPAAVAWRGVAGSAYHLPGSGVTSLPFYRHVAGIDDLAGNLGAMLISAVVIGGLLVIQRVAGAGSRGGKWARPSVIVAALLPPAVMWMLFPVVRWDLALRGLPLVLAVALVWEMAQLRRQPASPAAVTRLMWLAFSLVLLVKIAFAAQVQHYGFALAMPGTLALAAMLAGRWLPWNDRPDAPVTSRRPAAVMGISVLLSFIGLHLWVYARLYAQKPSATPDSVDRFNLSAGPPGRPTRGDALRESVAAVMSGTPRDSTLAVIPEGAMVNFLTRRRNPTPFITLQPPEYLMFGADPITQAYQSAPPDFVLLNLLVDPAEYGSKGFDQDYGKQLAEWIKANYAPVWQGPRMVLLKRK